jgi:hypothetical protein
MYFSFLSVSGLAISSTLFNKKAEQFQHKKTHLLQSLDHFREELNEVKLKVFGVLQ